MIILYCIWTEDVGKITLQFALKSCFRSFSTKVDWYTVLYSIRVATICLSVLHLSRTLTKCYMLFAFPCRVMIVNTVGLIVLWSLINYAGLVVFAVYADCDPLSAGYIKKSDQVGVFEDQL